MNPSSSPLVSICIPVHNCAAYIGAAIESVRAQTLSDWELIILDNASSDDTLDVIRSYPDARIRVIGNERNIGIEANWNRALREAKGRYIKLLPADDYLLPECLERQARVFDQPGNESVILTCCGRSIVGSSGNRLITRRYPGKEALIDGHGAIRRVVRSGTNLLGEPGAILFRRDILDRTGRFDGSLTYVIDVDLWLRMLLCGDLYNIPEALCAFRLSSGSYSVELAALHSNHFSALIRRLSADERYQVNRLDGYLGSFMSRILAWVRRLFYIATVRHPSGEREWQKRRE